MATHTFSVYVLACVLATALAYNFTTYKNEIEHRCLSQLWSPHNAYGQMHVGGLTMESFISMVEKVERNHTDWDIYQVSRVLLKRFAFDGITYEVFGGQRTAKQFPKYQTRWNIIEMLVGEGNRQDHFHEEDLNEQEKCTMFFMMGHLINNTFREGIDEESRAIFAPVPLDSSSNDHLRSPGMPSKVSKSPREQGVVSLRGNKNRAIAISKVLNAILASQNPQDININEVFHMNKFEEHTRDKKLNTLIGVSLADVVSVAAMQHKPGSSGLEFFGPGGEWNSSLCPTEFTLYENTTGATNALLRGAVDGLQIGFALKQLPTVNSRDLRLSRVLRMYYSTGLPSENLNQAVSHCNRVNVLQAGPGTTTIMESLKSFYMVHHFKDSGDIPPPENPIIENMAYPQLQAAINRLDDMENGDCKMQKNREVDRPVCETPSNVFIIMDESELRSEGFTEQEEIVGHLASHLDFGKGAGSLSVFYESRHSDGELKKVYYNATNPTCATCQAARIDRRNPVGTQENTVDILEAINKTLQHFELKTDLYTAVPNKVVVWFHYKEPSEKNSGRLNKAANLLRKGHRDARVIVVGRGNQDGLKPLATSPSDVITTASSAEETAKQIAKRICDVPAILQYNQCWNSKNRKEEEQKHSGYVSTGAVQYWALHPEYFLKSYDIEVKFKVETGDIKVCAERGSMNPGFSDDGRVTSTSCKVTENNKREVVFKYKDPCHKFDINTCRAINFAVIGVAPTATNRQFSCPGEDDNCRKLDQVKFTVTHKGVSCSNCDFLKASPVAMLLMCVVYFFTKSS